MLSLRQCSDKKNQGFRLHSGSAGPLSLHQCAHISGQMILRHHLKPGAEFYTAFQMRK